MIYEKRGEKHLVRNLLQIGLVSPINEAELTSKLKLLGCTATHLNSMASLPTTISDRDEQQKEEPMAEQEDKMVNLLQNDEFKTKLELVNHLASKLSQVKEIEAEELHSMLDFLCLRLDQLHKSYCK